MSNIPLSELRMSAPGQSGNVRARIFPRIVGGTCEKCGVIDHNYPGSEQYKFCEHYQGRDIKCSFCKPNVDHADKVRMSDMYMFEDPYLPGNLVGLCRSYECTAKFEKQYNVKLA